MNSTKAEERSMTQISFGTLDLNIEQAQSLCAKIHSWSITHSVFKICESSRFRQKSTIRELFKATSVDQKTYSLPSSKCIWLTWKLISAAYLKGLSKYKRTQVFFFLKYLLPVYRYWQIGSVMTSYCLQIKSGKIQSKWFIISGNKWSNVPQKLGSMWITKEPKWHPWCFCHHDSNSFSSSLFLSKKSNSSFATSKVRQRWALNLKKT